jgi:clan AA aspartic protease (TIGR02281 family)
MPVRPRALPLSLALGLALSAGLGLPETASAAGRSLGASWAAARKKAPKGASSSRRSRSSGFKGRTCSRGCGISATLSSQPSSRGVSRGQARITFRRGSTVIPARVLVNGAAGTFIVDTGASTVSISTRFARQLGLDLRRARPIQVMTASGPEQALLTRVARIELAGAVAEDVDVVVMNDPGGPKADGLLGLSFLARFHMSLDAHAGVLELRAP